MISRLTTAATIFAVLATSTIAWAATTRLERTATSAAATAAPLDVVRLPTVEVTGKRAAAKDAQR